MILSAQPESVVAADQAAAGDDKKLDEGKLDSRIKALMAMPAKERRAELKKLSPAERKGLWLAVKGSQFASRGEPAKYRDLKGFPVDVDQGFKGKRLLPKAAVGTIAYDSGFPSVGFGGGAIVGNRFNTHTGIPVCNPGTVSTIQALVVPGPAQTSSSAGFVLLGPQTTMGGAMALFSTFTAATGVIDSLTFAGLGVTYTGSSFFVLFGDFAASYIPVLGTGSTLGQGHHGVVGYTGMMGPNITGTFDFGGILNSYIRATGTIVPVELMAFEVE
jgi:hypothetical protein